MLSVLFTITRYWPAVGGAEIHTRALIHSLRGSVQPLIAAHWSENRTDWLLGTTLLAPRAPRRYLDDGVPVHLITPTYSERVATLPFVLGYYPLLPLAARRLGHVLHRHLERLDPGVQLVHNIRSGREPLSLASLELARRRGVPFVLTPNHHPRWIGWRYRVFQQLYREADALIALTEHERAELIRLGARPERVHVTGIGPVLANGASADRAREKFGLQGRFILFLGQKYPYKGLAALLEAAPRVWEKHHDVTLLFVGPRSRYSQRLFARVTDPRLRELPAVDLEDKTGLLRACEALCLPSAQESFGGVLVEAWACGKPVVAGPAPAIATLIDDGVDGLFVPRQSASVLAERLCWMLDDRERATTMGRNGARKVAERYTWERLAAQTFGIYQSLLG